MSCSSSIESSIGSPVQYDTIIRSCTYTGSRHKLELAVVVLTPPVLPAGLQALRVLRLLRLLRLVVAVELTRRLFSVDGVKYAAILTAVVIVAGG